MDKFNFNTEKALIYKIIAGLACLTLILCLFSCSDKEVKETLDGKVTVITESSTGLGETETLKVEVLEPVIELIIAPLLSSDTTQVIQ